MSEPKLKFDPQKVRLAVTRGELWEILASQEETLAKLLYLTQTTDNKEEFSKTVEEVLEQIGDNHKRIAGLITTGYEVEVSNG